MLFSGVSCPKSALTMAELVESDSVPWSPQVPKYFLPLALKALLMLAAAWRSPITQAEHAAEVKRNPARTVRRTIVIVGMWMLDEVLDEQLLVLDCALYSGLKARPL